METLDKDDPSPMKLAPYPTDPCLENPRAHIEDMEMEKAVLSRLLDRYVLEEAPGSTETLHQGPEMTMEIDRLRGRGQGQEPNLSAHGLLVLYP